MLKKFQAIVIGNKSKNGDIQFNLDGDEILCENEVKLLGVTIECQLNINTHISKISKKIKKEASRQLNVLKRIEKHLFKLGRLTIIITLILCLISIIALWFAICVGEVIVTKMEKIQERALRFIYEDLNSDYDTLLLKSGLPSLKIRRLRMMAIDIFKILHKQSPAYLNDIVSFKHISYSFRQQQIVEIRQVRRTTFGLHSIRYAGATL